MVGGSWDDCFGGRGVSFVIWMHWVIWVRKGNADTWFDLG